MRYWPILTALCLALLTSCSGGGGDDHYSLSGQVMHNGTPLSGAVVTLGGAGSGSTTTDSNGSYVFRGLSRGDYSVTPSLSRLRLQAASWRDHCRQREHHGGL